MYKELVLSFFFLVVTACTFFIIYRMYKPVKKSSARPASWYLLFICYLCAMATITIMPLRMTLTIANLESHFNFVPVMKSYHRFMFIKDLPYGYEIRNFVKNLVGNILLFIPFGIFLPLLYPKKKLSDVILLAVLSSAGIELIQYLNMFLGYYRYVDIDDVLLNTLGAITGYGLHKKFWNAGKDTRI